MTEEQIKLAVDEKIGKRLAELEAEITKRFLAEKENRPEKKILAIEHKIKKELSYSETYRYLDSRNILVELEEALNILNLPRNEVIMFLKKINDIRNELLESKEISGLKEIKGLVENKFELERMLHNERRKKILDNTKIKILSELSKYTKRIENERKIYLESSLKKESARMMQLSNEIEKNNETINNIEFDITEYLSRTRDIEIEISSARTILKIYLENFNEELVEAIGEQIENISNLNKKKETKLEEIEKLRVMLKSKIEENEKLVEKILPSERVEKKQEERILMPEKRESELVGKK